MHKERKTAKETFVLIKTGFPFPEREFAVEKHFFKTGLTFLSVLTNISFLNIAFGTVQLEKNVPRFGLLSANSDPFKFKMWYITKFFGSEVTCTPGSQNFLTLRSTISAKSKLNSKMFKLVYQGPSWVRIIKNEGQNLVTHSFWCPFDPDPAKKVIF